MKINFLLTIYSVAFLFSPFVLAESSLDQSSVQRAMNTTQATIVDPASPTLPVQPKFITPTKTQCLPRDASFLYDGSTIVYSNGQEEIVYDPKPIHERLAAVPDVSKNVATFALTFFVKKADGSLGLEVMSENQFYAEGLVKGTQHCNDTELLAYVYMHTAHLLNSKNITYEVNMIETFLELGKKARGEKGASKNPRAKIQSLGHSEQCILADLHKMLQVMIAKFTTEHKPQEIYGICLNLYTTNDSCTPCGATIEATLPTLRGLCVDILEAQSSLSTDQKQAFSFFAAVSSSKHYMASNGKRLSYLPRPVLQGAAAETRYYEWFYKANQGVHNGPFALNSKRASGGLNGKALYFWTPRPEYPQINLGLMEQENGAYSVTVGNQEQVVDLNQFLQVMQAYSKKLKILNFEGSAASFSTSNRNDVVNPRNIAPFKLEVLNMAGTLARSQFLYEMFEPAGRLAQSLVRLDLRGAIVNYSDDDAGQKKPHEKRRKLFEALAGLQQLTHLDLSAYNEVSNNVIQAELFWLIRGNKVTLPAIKHLNVSDNAGILDADENGRKSLLAALTAFSSRSIQPQLDLRRNGVVHEKFDTLRERPNILFDAKVASPDQDVEQLGQAMSQLTVTRPTSA